MSRNNIYAADFNASIVNRNTIYIYQTASNSDLHAIVVSKENIIKQPLPSQAVDHADQSSLVFLIINAFLA